MELRFLSQVFEKPSYSGIPFLRTSLEKGIWFEISGSLKKKSSVKLRRGRRTFVHYNNVRQYFSCIEQDNPLCRWEWKKKPHLHVKKVNASVRQICIPTINIISTLQTTRMKIWKAVRQTAIAIRFNLLQVHPSVPSIYCNCCVIYTFLQRFEGLFLYFTQFLGSFHCLNFDKFRDTVSRISGECNCKRTRAKFSLKPGFHMIATIDVIAAMWSIGDRGDRQSSISAIVVAAIAGGFPEEEVFRRKSLAVAAIIWKPLSQRLLSLRSLESGFHMITMITAIAKLFLLSDRRDRSDHKAIIWKPGLKS